MKQQLTRLSEFEEALLGSRPIVLLFTSEFCHACSVFKEKLDHVIEPRMDILYFELRRGDVIGLEKTFHLKTTPALVTISRMKKIVCDRQCDQMSVEELKMRLEEL